jgi:hypothetical protein
MTVKSPAIAWAAVAVVFIMTAGAVTLAALGKDTTVILALAAAIAVPVLGGFGAVIYQKLDKVDTNTNGKNDQQLAMIKDLHDKVMLLALQVPAPASEQKEDPWPGASGSSPTPLSPPTSPRS